MTKLTDQWPVDLVILVAIDLQIFKRHNRIVRWPVRFGPLLASKIEIFSSQLCLRGKRVTKKLSDFLLHLSLVPVALASDFGHKKGDHKILGPRTWWPQFCQVNWKNFDCFSLLFRFALPQASSEERERERESTLFTLCHPRQLQLFNCSLFHLNNNDFTLHSIIQCKYKVFSFGWKYFSHPFPLPWPQLAFQSLYSHFSLGSVSLLQLLLLPLVFVAVKHSTPAVTANSVSSVSIDHLRQMQVN